MFKANQQHPLFDEIHNIILKHVGLDQVVENVVKRLGDVQQVFLAGDFSRRLNSQIIDLIFVGNVDQTYLVKLITKTEDLVKRRIRYLIYTQEELETLDWGQFQSTPLLLWSKEVI